ncbi:MAG: TIGR04282 family arsenosugar biosynthesis glycosyltransferase [Acidimicrobiales bacterium]
MSATLLIMAKAPVPGRVKTRLCPPCTPAGAATLARAALEDTLANALATPGVSRVLLALEGEVGRWCPPGVEVVHQAGAGLADRLAHAWQQVEGPGIQIGMDTPQAGPALLRRALDALVQRGTRAVLGLAADGGWWAIGFRRVPPSAFTGIPMSTPWTGAAQLDRLQRLRLRVQLLPPLVDADRIEDARLVAAQAPRSRFAAALSALSLPPLYPVGTAGTLANGMIRGQAASARAAGAVSARLAAAGLGAPNQ